MIIALSDLSKRLFLCLGLFKESASTGGGFGTERMALRSAPVWLLVLEVVALQHMCLGSFSHSLKLTCFTISEPSQELPRFVMLGHVDDHVVLHYDRETRKVQPRVSWIEKLQEDDPELWDKMFKEAHDIEKMFTYGLEFVRIFSSRSEGLHIVQVIAICDLQGDGSKRGFVQMAYNGEPLLPLSTLDKSEMEECSALLEKFLSYGNETLLRTEPPVVTVTRRVEAKDGMETHICRAHGFYPRAINASWTRDGEVWLQDTLHRHVAPNADGTYHYWLSIQIDPEERGRYKCHVEHDGLQEPLDVALKGTTVWARGTTRPFSSLFTARVDSSQQEERGEKMGSTSF